VECRGEVPVVERPRGIGGDRFSGRAASSPCREERGERGGKLPELVRPPRRATRGARGSPSATAQARARGSCGAACTTWASRRSAVARGSAEVSGCPIARCGAPLRDGERA
jgi:hypothetical protein